MDNKKRSLFAGFICAAYIVTAVAFAASLGVDISKGRSAAVTRFRMLTNETDTILKDNIVRSESFYDSFLRALGDVSDLAGVQIKDSQGLVISYPASLGEDSTNFPGVLVEPYTHDKKMHDKSGQEVNLKAAIHLLKPADFYRKARITFLAILAETLICLLYLIYVSIYTDGETEIEEEAELEEEQTADRQASVTEAPAAAVPQATAVPQAAVEPAAAKPPVVIVNVNSSPSGAATVETTSSTADESSTEEVQKSTAHEATVAMEEDDQPVFRNYELTQEEYQGLLAEDLDEPEEDEDADDFDGLDDLDEEDDLDATLREGEDEDSDETIISQPKSEDDDLLDEQDDTISLSDNDDDDLLDEQDDLADAQDTAAPEPTAQEKLSDKNDDTLFDRADDEDDFLEADDGHDANEEPSFVPANSFAPAAGDTEDDESKKHTAEESDDDLFDTLDETDDDEMEEFASEEVPTDAVPFQEGDTSVTGDDTDSGEQEEDILAEDDAAESGESGEDTILDDADTAVPEEDILAEDDAAESSESGGDTILDDADTTVPEEKSSEEEPHDDADTSTQEDAAEDTDWTPRTIPAIDDSIFDESEEAAGDSQDTDTDEFELEEDESSLEPDEDTSVPVVEEATGTETATELEEAAQNDDDILDDEEDISVPVIEESAETEETVTETEKTVTETGETTEEPAAADLPSDDEWEDILDEDDKTSFTEEKTAEEVLPEPEPSIETESEAAPTLDETAAEPEPAIETETEAAPTLDETAAEPEPAIETEEEAAPTLDETAAEPEPAIETEEEAAPTLDETAAEPEPAIETEEEAPVISSPAPSGPTGLYSGRTGFGWESYMLPRMDNEISRCTKSGQDISVISLRIDGIDWTKDEGKAVCESVKDILSSPDLIFEKGDDAFTAALPDTNVNEAIGLAENLYSSIDEILAQYGNDAPMGIGISSRSLRMISGERLTNEADVALNHAMEDAESPIVAFKVDPQKYRKFLAAQAEQEE